ncbi:TetR/AcrR family transcriptional regulator [Nesterenkonia haasae]|uniref:TetR/AcrR family transcriptional regulator n=1 Tax=Nesterenkonia haasae TaxID=2587813 RepID=UPI00139076C8|nr:TetR/AcrR family transcriptional regulator [Nesterenkonia haasae]NDK32775.1 TetR/AcrR family transcriptional regulator [Nesterenkonia haasae]
MSSPRQPRVSIEERREQILDAALIEFGHKGLHGGSTVHLAKAIGISHPNLFRVFSTKKGLFMAVLQRAFETIEREMIVPGERAENHHLWTMAHGWSRLMENRELMLILLQGFAASADPEISDLMRSWTGDVFERSEGLPGVTTDEAHFFFASGMLYLAAAAMDLPAHLDAEPWAERFMSSGGMPPTA